MEKVWNMEWKIFKYGMEWQISKGMEYENFHSIPYHALVTGYKVCD